MFSGLYFKISSSWRENAGPINNTFSGFSTADKLVWINFSSQIISSEEPTKETPVVEPIPENNEEKTEEIKENIEEKRENPETPETNYDEEEQL